MEKRSQTEYPTPRAGVEKMRAAKLYVRPLLVDLATCAVVLLVLGFAAYAFFGTKAWFADNRSVIAGGVNVEVEGPDLFVTDFTSYKVTEEYIAYAKNHLLDTAVDKEPLQNPTSEQIVVGNSQELTMNTFDSVYSELGAYTPSVLRITIGGSAVAQRADLQIAVEAVGSLWMGEGEEKTIANYLANVLRLDCLTMDLAEPENAALLWNSATGKTGSVTKLTAETAQTYVDAAPMNVGTRVKYVVASDFVKRRTVRFSLSNYTLNEDGTVTVYLVLNYDTDLVSAYLDDNNTLDFSTVGSSDVKSVAMQTDLQKITVTKVN